MFEPTRPAEPAAGQAPAGSPAPLSPDQAAVPAAAMEELSRPSQPVTVSPVRSGRRFGVRWAVAALTLVLVASVSVAAGSRLIPAAQAGSGGSGLAAWAPAGTVMYVELHPNAPGDQHARLAQFAANFPGFSDTAKLDANLAEMYDELLALHATKSGKDVGNYSTDIAPWFGGTVAMAVTGLPDLPATGTGTSSGHAPSAASRAALKAAIRQDVVGLVSITDATAAGAWAQKRLAADGATVSTATHGAAQLYTAASSGDGTVSVAVLPGLLVAGETATVTSVVDGGGAGGLATSAGFTSAQQTVPSDTLAAWYVNLGEYVRWAKDQAATRSGSAPCDTMTATIPQWVAGGLTANATALTGHSSLPHVDRAVTANTASALLAHLPASTLVAVDTHEVGASVAKAVAQMRSCSSTDEGKGFAQIDAAVQRIGGWDSLTGWMGEAAIAFQQDGTHPTGGLLIAPKDAAAADAFRTELHNLLALAGSRVQSADETYAGQTVTTITMPDAPASAPKVAFVFTPDVVAIGTEPWVKAVLDTTAGSSLASDAAFTAALAQVQAQNAGLVYANVAALRDLAEAKMPASAAAKYAAWKPYVAPFQAFIGTATVGSDLDHLDTALTVK